MFLPWVGLFEQVRLADTFVHYDDVQLPQGRSFMSRVQVKTPNGTRWLTAPIDRAKSGRLINETVLLPDLEWRRIHLQTLKHCYGKAPHFTTMFDLAREIYACREHNLALFNRHALELIADFMGLGPRFLASSELRIDGTSSARLVHICRALGAQKYITGLGALNYLDYAQFEAAGVAVHYMAYQKRPYKQSHGEFTPYVTVLDAVAHCGTHAAGLLCSASVYWKDYVEQSG